MRGDTPASCFGLRRLGLADPEDEQRRAEEADGVEDDRNGRAQQVDEDARQDPDRRAARRAADLQLRVPLDELVPVDERRQIRLVGNVEEDGRDPDEEAHCKELPDRQRIECVRDRDRDQEPRARKISEDENRTTRQTIDPHSRRQADEDEREKLDDVQGRDLEHRRVQHDHRGERQRERAELRPELTDGLRRPELEKIRVLPETPFWPEGHDCSVASTSAGARSMRTSPDTVFAKTSTSGLSGAGACAGASPRSSSELVDRSPCSRRRRPSAAADADGDVAGDRLQLDATLQNRFEVLVPGRPCSAPIDALASRTCTSPRRAVPQVAADRADMEVAGHALNVERRLRLVEMHVAARRLDANRSACFVELQIAGGRLDLDAAVLPARPQVGGLGANVEVCTLWADDAQANVRPAEANVRAPAERDEDPLSRLRLDDDLVPVCALDQLDAGVVDEVANRVVLRDCLQLDVRFVGAGRLDLDLARGDLEVEQQGARRGIGLGPHQRM